MKVKFIFFLKNCQTERQSVLNYTIAFEELNNLIALIGELITQYLLIVNPNEIIKMKSY